MILRCCAYELSFINVSPGHFPKRDFRKVSFFVVVEIQIRVKNNSAGRLYDKIGDKAKGKVVFVVDGGGVCRILVQMI